MIAPTSSVSFVSSVGVKGKELRLDERALHGVVGEWVDAISPYVEADPVGIAVSLLVGFGSAAGRTPYVEVGPTRHHANEFALLVGPTASGRKGEAMTSGLRPLLVADEDWKGRVKSGFGSGESIISFLSHPHGKNEVNEVTRDDRLLVHEGEFASVLTVAGREGSTLSSLLRAGWDGVPLENHTKQGHLEAPDAHLSVLAGVTDEELRERVTKTDLANGFLNRFLLVVVQRTKLLSSPPPIPAALDAPYAEKIRGALAFARTHGTSLRRDKAAAALYDDAYHAELSVDRMGLAGKVCSRAEPHVVRLSMLYALLDQSKTIRVEHVEAALALWRYCEQSAQLIFGNGTGDADLDKMLGALEEAGRGGLSRTEVSGVFSGNRPKEHIDDRLGRGMEIGRIIGAKETSGGRGRPAEKFWLTAYAPKEALEQRGQRLLNRLRPLVRDAAANGSDFQSISESLIRPAEQQYGVTLDEDQMHDLLMLTEPDLEEAF